MIKGIVTRPEYTNGDGELKLTATITKGSVTKTVVFDASVKEQGMTDSQAVNADKLALIFPVDKDNIRANVNLPSTGNYGSTVTWATSADNIMTADGIVARPANGASLETGKVTMTATLTKGEVVETKEFKCTVLPWTDEEEVDLAISDLTWERIKGNNMVKTEVVTDLVLSEEGLRETTIKWISNNENIVTSAGKVTRPSYTQGDVLIALNATVTKGTCTKPTTISGLRVVKLNITNKESVDKAILNIDKTVVAPNPSFEEITQNFKLPVRSSLPDCSTVKLEWSLVNSENEVVPSHDNIRLIKSEGQDVSCVITRPSASEKNGEVSLKVVADSSALSGSSASSYKTIPIVILKESAE